jgi:RNA polymerase sigma-70 factor (ECF subfamily)
MPPARGSTPLACIAERTHTVSDGQAAGGEPPPAQGLDWEEIYREFVHAIIKDAFLILLNMDDATDVAQEVFADALERQPNVENPGAWLRTTTRNRAVDLYRRRRRWAKIRELLAGRRENPIAEFIDPAELICDRETWIQVRRALADLSVEQRAVAVACLMQGISQAEYARLHNVSVSTVKTHYMRVVRKLKARLGTEGEQVIVRFPTVEGGQS